MVQIHKKSVVVNKKFFDVELYGKITRNALQRDFMDMLSNIDFDIIEFPAPDGSVELVAEVVTMTKQDYDDLMAFLKGVYHGNDMAQSMLVAEIYKRIVGKYPK